jgi:hypothetical protein
MPLHLRWNSICVAEREGLISLIPEGGIVNPNAAAALVGIFYFPTLQASLMLFK